MSNSEYASYSSIVFIANIASPEVKLVNEIEDFCEKHRISLVKIIFDSHDANIKDLNMKNLIYYGSQDPSFLGMKLFNHNEKTKSFVVKGEKDSIKFTRGYLSGLNRYRFELREVCKNLKSPLFIINNQLGSVFRISERYARANGVGCLIYNRWYKPNTYTLSPLPFVGCLGQTFRNKLCNSTLPYNPRYRSDSYQLNESDYCLVLLGSDDIGFRNAEQWKGLAFGNLTQLENTIISELSKGNHKVVVRPHPHNKASLNAWLGNTNFIDGSDFDMDELIKEARFIITTQTSAAFRALEVFQKEIAVIGCFDNMSDGVVNVHCLDSLRNYLSDEPKHIDSSYCLSAFLNERVYVTGENYPSLATMVNYVPDSDGECKTFNMENPWFIRLVKMKAILYKFRKKILG